VHEWDRLVVDGSNVGGVHGWVKAVPRLVA